MKIKTTDLLEEMREKTQSMMERVEVFSTFSDKELNWRQNEKTWSVLECLEHINLYGDFYLKKIEDKVLQSSYPTGEYFKPGWFGDFSVKQMLPKENGKMWKMNTFKDMNPIHSNLSVTTIQRFFKQQEQFLILLEQVKKVNLTKTKIPLTIKGMRFRLGDTLRFLVYHNERHILQAERVVILREKVR